MKHLKKHLQKISKESIKKVITGLVVLFFGMVMLFQKDTSTTTQLSFVWNADEMFMHNAASQQRDYLFQDEWGQQIYQGQINTGNTTSATDTINSLINPDEVEQILNATTGQSLTWILYTGTVKTGTQIPMTGTVKTWSLDCITPRKEEVKNKDFVLAYEQRKDVSNICNIEKRICTNGVLGWTFKQRSCEEDIVYTYRKAEVISYNQKILNEYIQPTAPVNSWAEFNTQGQISTTPVKATDTRWTTNSPVITDSEVNESPLPNKANCTTPRGQKIKHGQFIKAYKAPRGFIDLPCKVEIRACVNGNLKGTFAYSKCTFNNTSYAEYLKAGSPRSNTWFLFFERIKKTFKRWK